MSTWLHILIVVQWLDTDVLTPGLALVMSAKQRSFANEVGLFPGHNARKTNIQRVGHSIRIRADVQVAFLGPEHK